MSGPRAGIDRVAAAFDRATGHGASALVAYLMAGHPGPGRLPGLVLAAARAGADVVEVGIPCSDPLADGPTIRSAGRASLAAGMTVDRALEELAQARRLLDAELPGRDVPILVMGYANPLLLRGPDHLVEALVAAGADGAIIPDQPPEEDEELAAACSGASLARVHLVTPMTDATRMEEVAGASSGFVYCVATTGTTGARATLAADLGEVVARARAAASLPVAVGFGISRPEDAARVAGLADGVVVGSALLDAIDGAGADAQAQEDAVGQLVGALAAAVSRGSRAPAGAHRATS